MRQQDYDERVEGMPLSQLDMYCGANGLRFVMLVFPVEFDWGRKPSEEIQIKVTANLKGALDKDTSVEALKQYVDTLIKAD